MSEQPRFTYVHAPQDEDGLVHMFESDQYHLEREFDQVVRWCAERFGPFEDMERWAKNGHADTIWFRSVDDAFEFRMRWC